MIATLVLLVLNSVVLYFAFRALSTSSAALSPVVRTVLAVVAVFAAATVSLWFRCSTATLLTIAAAAAFGSLGISGNAIRLFGDALGSNRFLVYILSIASLSFLVFIFVPITTFLSSPGEIGLHLDYLLTTNLRDAMIVVYVAAALYAMALAPRMKTVLSLLSLGAVALGLIYAYVLPFGYPMMTGLTFEQVPISATTRALRAAIDLVLVAALALAIRWLVLRLGGRPIVIGLLLANASLAGAAVVTVMRNPVADRGGAGEDQSLSSQPLRFSPTHPNVLVVFLDRFMGSYIESIVLTDPLVADRLSGFTWYPRTVSAGENSIAGVHPMLGGYDYTPIEMNRRNKPLRDLSVEAFSILPYNFSRKGYQVNVVDPRGLGFTMAGDCSYLAMPNVTCTHISPAISTQRAKTMGFPLADLSTANYAELLVLLGSMRGAPYIVKEVLRVRGPWRPFLDHSAGTTFRVWAELQAFGELSMTKASEPNFNFVSSILPHEPYFIGEDCLPKVQKFELPAREILARGHPSLFSLQHAIAARCTLLAVADYLDFLKKAGVYDNTKIVIVSDHGIVGPVEDHSSRAVAGGTVANKYVRMRPVLLVKEIGASGRLKVSEDYLPNAEVPRIVCAVIGGCVNPYLANRTIEAHGRDDPFMISLVPWQFSMQQPKAFVIHTQLALGGQDPFDPKGWRRIN